MSGDRGHTERKISLSNVISGVALLLSAAAFYDSSLRVDHSLKFSVVELADAVSEVAQSRWTQRILVQGVVANDGNRSELITGSDLVFSGGTPMRIAPHVAATVLKPGDTLPLMFDARVTDETVGKMNSGSIFDLDVILVISFVAEDGRHAGVGFPLITYSYRRGERPRATASLAPDPSFIDLFDPQVRREGVDRRSPGNAPRPLESLPADQSQWPRAAP